MAKRNWIDDLELSPKRVAALEEAWRTCGHPLSRYELSHLGRMRNINPRIPVFTDKHGEISLYNDDDKERRVYALDDIGKRVFGDTWQYKAPQTKPRKRVRMTHPESGPVAIFNSVSEASQKTRISADDICAACEKLVATVGGHVWEYIDTARDAAKAAKKNRAPGDPWPCKKTTGKRVQLVPPSGPIVEFASISHAEDDTGMAAPDIVHAIASGNPVDGGYIWRNRPDDGDAAAAPATPAAAPVKRSVTLHAEHRATSAPTTPTAETGRLASAPATPVPERSASSASATRPAESKAAAAPAKRALAEWRLADAAGFPGHEVSSNGDVRIAATKEPKLPRTDGDLWLWTGEGRTHIRPRDLVRAVFPEKFGVVAPGTEGSAVPMLVRVLDSNGEWQDPVPGYLYTPDTRNKRA